MSCTISCIEITIICINRHDGFTLQDLVSYNHNKHNEANSENNRDGCDFNMSFNHGVEGPTTDASVLAAREEHKAWLMRQLMTSKGHKLLLAGDEFGNVILLPRRNKKAQSGGIGHY